MSQKEKIPIIVGVTGHRNIVNEDKPAIKALVTESLKEIQALCREKGGEDMPVVMLNAFAEGADMLCAEAAFELGIDVYALLPCPVDKYIQSFDDEEAKNKLLPYLEKTQRQIIAPDIEKNRSWMNINDDSYEYRQLGIYMAKHSHILLALWDGKPPKTKYGCGTVEVIDFALEHKYLDKDNLFKPGQINDTAVVWIKSRRETDKSAPADVSKKWLTSSLVSLGKKDGGISQANETGKSDSAVRHEELDSPPEFLTDIIKKTAEYNKEAFTLPDEEPKLWKIEAGKNELDEYRRGLRYHYAKADNLSYHKNQVYYNRFLLAIAILATFVALSFLIYDDAGLPFMIFPCTALLGAIILLSMSGKKKAFHKNYIEYRAFAEAVRIQFYLSMCIKSEEEIVTNVSDLYSWTQKTDMAWIAKAIQAMSVIYPSNPLDIDTSKVIDVWIGKNEKPTGQLKYHSDRKEKNNRLASFYDRLSGACKAVAIVLYFVIFVFEVVACILKACKIDWFWEGTLIGHLAWRNFTAIILGIVTAGSLLLSSYWGKLSFDRKADDNKKMIAFYASAYSRWNEVKDHPEAVENFVTEIAREEIVENGIWCSYVSENRLEISI